MKSLKLISLSFLFLLIQGCSESGEPLSYASHVWPGYEFVFLAKNIGLLDQEKIHITETKSATDSLELLYDKKVEAAALTLDEVILARSKGVNLSIVSVFNVSAGADMVVSKKPLKSLKDLKGQRLGVETNTLGSLVLSQLLQTAGLELSDITVVNMAVSQQEQAWQENRVDSVITYQPVASKLLKSGGVKIFDSREMPEVILDVLAVRNEALHKKEQIKHLVEMHFQALHYLEIHQQDAVYRMAARLNVAPGEVFDLYKGLRLPNQTHNKRLMAGNGAKIKQAARLIVELMNEKGVTSFSDDFYNLVDPSYL